MKKLLLTVGICLLLGSTSRCLAQDFKYPFLNYNLTIDQRVDDLLGRLELQEKVGLMMNASIGVERLGIPKYDWWNEALHGVARAGRATVFPQAIGMAATFNDADHFKTFSMISDEARVKYRQAQKDKNYERYYGLTFWTPNINIFRDPRWGRGMETYGEDPYLTGRLGVAAVKGLQGDDSKYYKTHACAKHYAVHSGPEWSRHSYDANVSSRDLWETYLPAFEELVKEGNVQEVMCAYNRFEGEPCCGSDKLLIDILRNKWQYKGLIVSDCSAINDFFKKGHHETHPDAASATSAAVLSGTDLECGRTYDALVEAVNKGLITEKDIDVSLARLLKSRFELGMFDPDEKVNWMQIPETVFESKEHKAQALKVAHESMTLLQNNNNTLPLNKNIRSIAVIGANADDSVMMWANYNGFPSETITILQGIKNKLPNTKVIYEKGCSLVGDFSEAEFAELKAKIKDVDAIIYVGGLSSKLEGEEMRVNAEGFRGGDRTTIELPAIQRKMLAELRAIGKPVVFVLCTGSAIALGEDQKNYDALLNSWYSGQEGGRAVADVLVGDYNPAGRLPVTFYKSQSQLPEDFENYDMTGRTYRYLNDAPLYPFGYGLSYTTFEYGNAKLSNSKIKAGDSVTISFDIANTGKLAGDEVAQIYVKRLNDGGAPIKALKAFRRVNIAAGSSNKLTFELEPKAFTYFNDQTAEMEVMPGDYMIMYGSSSDDKDLKTTAIKIVK